MDGTTTAASIKKKVLISFVGNHDPYGEDGEGAVLTIIHEESPDLVLLFPSARSAAEISDNHTEGRAEEIIDILSRHDSPPVSRIIPLNTDNPADHDKCYKAFKNCFMQAREILEREVKGGINNCDLLVNVSSGTQQMNLAGRLFLNSYGVSPIYLRVDNPKFANGQTTRVHHVSQKMEEEMVLLRAIDRNLSSFHFHSVADSCADLAERSLLVERRTFAKALVDIFRAYELLDTMDYERALEKLQRQTAFFAGGAYEAKAAQAHLDARSIVSVLDEQIAFLRKINANSESESTHNLTDLFFNMKRAFGRKNYADVLSRFWRLHEGALYIRLRDKGFTVRKLNTQSDVVQRLMSKDNKYKKKMIFENGKKRFEGNIKDLVDLLTKELCDVEADAFERQYHDSLEKLRIRRNHTIVAHGMKPVSQDDAEICMELGEHLIDLIPGGRKAYEEYPFTQENMKTLFDMLRA